MCSVCGKSSGRMLGPTNVYGSPLCEKHYAQYRRVGYFLDTSQRSSNDPNEIVIKEEYAEIILYKYNTESKRALIDIDDISVVSGYKWNAVHSNYVTSKTGGPTVLLHRLIMGPSNSMTVDHINHNPLDNRRSNLRVCTQQENSFNKKILPNNTSGVKGVSFDSKRGLWESSITKSGKRYYLGRYTELDDAERARTRAERDLFGEYRYRGNGE